MRLPKTSLVGILVILGWCSGAAAQTCAGAAPFGKGMLQAGAALALSPHAQALGVSFGGGADQFFGIAEFNGQGIDGVLGHFYGIQGTIGADQSLDPARLVHLCPLISFGRTAVPKTVGQADGYFFDASFGGDIGIVAGTVHGVTILPTIGLFYQHERATFTTRLDSSIVDTSTNFGMVRAGMGFAVNDRLSFVPEVTFPFAVSKITIPFASSKLTLPSAASGADRSFSISLLYNFTVP
jgi:hypothetical protein